MPRPPSVQDDELFDRLVTVFRTSGFEGASLGDLAAATNLRRASLYHRFPDGKAEMAEAVLTRLLSQFEQVLEPMRSAPDVAAGIAESARHINEFYAAGRLPCVLDTLSLAGAPERVRAKAGELAKAWSDAMAAAARRGGCTRAVAQRRARDALVRFEGALVVARVLGDTSAFTEAVRELPRLLLGE